MTRLRRALGSLVVLGLLFQAATMTLAAAGVLHDDHDGAGVVCTCAHASDHGHGSCPMHRTDNVAGKCRIQGTQSDTGTALLSLLSVVAVPAESRTSLAAPSVTTAARTAAWRPVNPVFSPDSPPPRG
jgi:hypothetical protein